MSAFDQSILSLPSSLLQYKERRMTMDFSQLHSYTPPECDPDNTGYTYALSSSYSKAALEFEKKNQMDPVYDSPRMSRRSLRLRNRAGFHRDESQVDNSQNYGSGYVPTSRETRVHWNTTSSSATLSSNQRATPRMNLSFSAASTPIRGNYTETDQSHLIQQTVTTGTVNEQQDHYAFHNPSSVNGNTSVSQSPLSMNGYMCRNCLLNSQETDSCYTQSSSQARSSQAAETGADFLSSSSSPFTSIYTRDRRLKKAGFLGTVSNGCARCCKQAMASVVSLFITICSYAFWVGSKVRSQSEKGIHKAHSSFCGSMNVKELMKQDESHLNLNGSLWLGSGVGYVGHSLLAVLWTLFAFPVAAVRKVFWLLATGWYGLVYLMSALNVFFLTRILPKLWILLWLLLPLLLFLALWLWGPSLAFLSSFPSTTSVPLPVPGSDNTINRNPATPASQVPPIRLPETVSALDLERLKHMEHQLAQLFERIHHRDQREEQLHTPTDKQSLGLWVSSLLEQKIKLLRGELDQENTLRVQSVEERLQQGQAARLADVELLIKALSDKTEEVQQKQQQFEHKAQKQEEEVVTSSADTLSVSEGVKQKEHDALLVEVQRLELELGKIRHDLQGVMGCKGKCEQLDTLQETITSQVTAQMRKQLQALFFDNTGSGEEQREVPESLILWLSQRYVTTPDLQASLAALEQSILRKISLQLEQSRAQTSDKTEFEAEYIVQKVTGTVQHTTTAEGLSEEHVKLIVQNALKLYSQDQIGLVDYALESAGGSILSTRCSETYETKTALMSLFGLPLWYFSQSPRVAIQPDVYPGNCWAFKGSQGYLVIRLSMNIVPSSFSVEHIPKSLSLTGKIASAPRDFTVYGLDDESQEEGKLLGQYTYQEDGESLQTFNVEEQSKAFQIIEVRVLSNWGHPDYTCLYRFRVHGKPSSQ
ncbi:SUN domain-containing protein 1 isoform X13 [Gouania willdenowi]|uniref:SUN domain-containing protein 1 isoform X13 n=1 Tax=Gouania willdenowi TaxID=441366 RepID=UPI001055D994|nr:SUN domain-containing protein 1-like isoform X13 [Gouania willdenowi]